VLSACLTRWIHRNQLQINGTQENWAN